jgi:hypothetical protein
MHIHVDPSTSPARISLLEADDFRAFDVVLLDGAGAPEDALSQLGTVAEDGGHVFVEPARLRQLAGDRAADPEWLAGLEKMTAFAAEHGWVDDAGRIRAHVVVA